MLSIYGDTHCIWIIAYTRYIMQVYVDSLILFQKLAVSAESAQRRSNNGRGGRSNPKSTWNSKVVENSHKGASFVHGHTVVHQPARLRPIGLQYDYVIIQNCVIALAVNH